MAEEFDAYAELNRLRIDTPEERARQVDAYLDRLRLVAAIEATGFADDALIEAELREMRANVLVSRYFEQFLDGAVSDDAVAEYYQEHREEFEEHRVRVAHVFFAVPETADEAARAAQHTQARAASSAIARGDAVASVAAAMSEDRVTAGSGGDLGWVRAEELPDAVAERVFDMSPSSGPEIVESEFGYHVVVVTEGPAVVPIPWDTASANIRSALRAQARAAEFARLVGQEQP